MSSPSRIPSFAWLIVPVCALAFIVWTDLGRIARVEYVNNTDREDAIVDVSSPTGYAAGKRWLIVPEHNNRSYQWISETQQMFAQGEWRVRHVDYENAPLGREVHSASLYRWWLGLIAWFDHVLSDRPLGLSVERAALYADPLLHVLLLIGATAFVARQFGPFAAALMALGLATIYPFAGGYLPGAPDEHGLARALALWSVLPVLAVFVGRKKSVATNSNLPAAASDRIGSDRRAQWLFFGAGMAGGVGLWVSAATQAPVLMGVAMGGLLSELLSSRGKKDSATDPIVFTPWRTWALGGAFTCLAGYLIEYFPAHLDFRLQVNHPLYGLAWIGVGELLGMINAGVRRGKSFWSPARVVLLLLALAAMAALPVAMARTGTSATELLKLDPYASRLNGLPNGVVAKSLAAWVARDGFTGPVCATCLPLLLIGPALWLLIRGKTAWSTRAGIALAIGPLAVALFLAFRQLSWWSVLDEALLLLVVASSMAFPLMDTKMRQGRWALAGLVGVLLVPGIVQLVPPGRRGGNFEFTRFEVEGLIERAIAHWITDHAGPDGATVLLPPDRTTSWGFHGGLRGIGTANWENRDGFAATVRIVTATTTDEAQALLAERGIKYLVLPSWDADLDEFARWSLRNPEDAFIMALHHWALPPWLRPLPYQLPAVTGFENQSVIILQVTEDSNRAAALGRLAEYFVEMQQLGQAATAGQALQRYPTDLNALVALAQVEKARGDIPAFTKAFNAVISSVSGGFDRALAWDRRVSLAVALALGGREDLSREQVRRCVEKIDEARIRSLTTGSLYHLLVLEKAYGPAIADQRLRELALQLLPRELRSRL